MTSGLETRVRALLDGGERDAAATAVLEALGPGVLRYLSAMLPHDDGCDAFSLFQQDVWRGLPGFRWECCLRSWIYRVASHAAVRVTRDGYRRRKERLSPRMAATLPSAALPEAGGPRERLASLEGALTSEERTLLALRVDRDLEWTQVAAILAAGGETVSAAALRKRFERLKGKLAVLARERGLLG